ncbi:MAG: hypothetical protein ACC742_16095 [Thermoanaerobaculales bacterium]
MRRIRRLPVAVLNFDAALREAERTFLESDDSEARLPGAGHPQTDRMGRQVVHVEENPFVPVELFS